VNIRGIRAIYTFEMSRTLRTLGQSIAAPVISTVLYFIVFGSAIGSRMQSIDGIPYGAFIVPGLIMLTVLGESVSNASFGIYFPRFTGTIYEILSAPLSFVEVVLGYVGAAATKSVLIGVIVLSTAWFFVPLQIIHPLWMTFFLVMTSLTFSLLGFIIGIWADGFEKIQLIPLLIITPLTFLGGSFYSIHMLPPFWYQFSLLNPVVYLVSGFRWSFYEHSDVSLTTSVLMILIFTVICLGCIGWIFKTGYGLKK
jgi:ABC-2 type transport system permease protein